MFNGIYRIYFHAQCIKYGTRSRILVTDLDRAFILLCVTVSMVKLENKQSYDTIGEWNTEASVLRRDEIMWHSAKRLVPSITHDIWPLRSGVLKLRQWKNDGYMCTYFPRYVVAESGYHRVRERNASKESKEHYVNRKMRARPIPTPKERTTHCPKSCSVRCSIYPGICLVNFHFDLRFLANRRRGCECTTIGSLTLLDE